MGAASWVLRGCQLSPWAAFQLRRTCQALPALRGVGAWPQPHGLLDSAAPSWFWGEVGDMRHMERGKRE